MGSLAFFYALGIAPVFNNNSPAVHRSRVVALAKNAAIRARSYRYLDMLFELEFRCRKEVANASVKMTFDGSVDTITCITQHKDYAALTNRTVLIQVAPLLRGANGSTYCCQTGILVEE